MCEFRLDLSTDRFRKVSSEFIVVKEIACFHVIIAHQEMKENK